jgi:serine/threonine-protein kinase RsbT
VYTLASESGQVSINFESDIIVARRMAREIATALGFGMTDITRIVTAVSELARNIFLYAGTGVMSWRILKTNNKTGLELIFKDHGPGIPDINMVLQGGHSSGNGLGLGLKGAKTLMDEMQIKTKVGIGTEILIKKWRRD